MGRILIESGGLHLELDPVLGAGIAEFSMKRGDALCPLMRRSSSTPTGFNDLACYLLAPWSNRIADGRFRWRAREHQVRPDWPDGTAIHGLVKDRPWRIIDRSPLTATLEFDSRAEAGLAFPWPFRAVVRYALSEDTLSVSLSVRNEARNGDPMPAGLGFHPFFPRALAEQQDQVSIRYSGRGRYPARGMIPTGPAAPDDVTLHLASDRPLEELALDDVFLGSANGATITWPASGVRLVYSCSPTLSHAVIYTGLADAFCFEPVTMVNDGFNLAELGWPQTGVAGLRPGTSLSAEWSLRIDTL